MAAMHQTAAKRDGGKASEARFNAIGVLTMHSSSVHFDIPFTRWPRFILAAVAFVASAGAVAGGGAEAGSGVAAAAGAPWAALAFFAAGCRAGIRVAGAFRGGMLGSRTPRSG